MGGKQMEGDNTERQRLANDAREADSRDDTTEDRESHPRLPEK